MNMGRTEVDATFFERVKAYLDKAVHEAKSHSSWISQDTKYDAAVSRFIVSILDEKTRGSSLADLKEFLKLVHPFGIRNSLSQTLIQCTAPGVPDIYQGSDSWDYSLVDPDNRRPVDYESRQRDLDQLATVPTGPLNKQSGSIPEIWNSDRAKLFVTSRALQLRQRRSSLFQLGQYVPLATSGPDAEHLFAFLMHHEGHAIIVVVPRLLSKLSNRSEVAHGTDVEIDATVCLPSEWSAKNWRHVFTGSSHSCERSEFAADDLFREGPVALLESDSVQ